MPGYLWLMLAAAFGVSAAGTWAYRAFAMRRNIVANPNFRTLHQGRIPRGGGIVFSVMFLIAALALWAVALIDSDLGRALAVGGVVATAFGFADDKFHLGAREKLLVQGALSAWTLFAVGGHPLIDFPLTPLALDLVISWLALVWLLNLYNFIDGIDGMAAAGAILISTTAIGVLMVQGGDFGLTVVLSILAACCLGFLVFNWPPASIFMGDSGSMFLGFSFGVLVTYTISRGQMSVWTWLVIFGYFVADTTTTTVLRLFVTEKWYGEHRSHAYQNLARIRGSHLYVVRGVCLYHLVWIAPLAIWSVMVPGFAPLATLLALAPVVGLALRFGPLLSSS